MMKVAIRTKSRNKKVLLRERKRHTARRVVTIPSVVLTGYPPPRRPDLAGGGRVPYLGPPGRVSPLVSAPWHSGKCSKVLWDMGTPPPVDRQMEGQTHVKTLPSRRTTYAVGNNQNKQERPRIIRTGSVSMPISSFLRSVYMCRLTTRLRRSCIMGSAPILSVNVSVTTDTMFNFNWEGMETVCESKP